MCKLEREGEQGAMLYLEIRPLPLKGELCRAHKAEVSCQWARTAQAWVRSDFTKMESTYGAICWKPAPSLTAASPLKWRGVFLGLIWMRALLVWPPDSFSGWWSLPIIKMKQHLSMLTTQLLLYLFCPSNNTLTLNIFAHYSSYGKPNNSVKSSHFLVIFISWILCLEIIVITSNYCSALYHRYYAIW